MKRFIILVIMALGIGSLIFAQTDRSTRYVAVQTTALKSSAGFLAKDLGSLSLGDVVSVIRDDGKWSEVRAGNLNGWVASSSLSARRVAASNTTVTASEVALAGKGFSPDMEIEYKKNGLNYSMVDAMEQIVIPTDDLQQFVTEGRLTGGK